MFATLPTPDEVARRALAVSALVCRASIEDPSNPGIARTLHAQVLRWVSQVGAAQALEPAELEILEKPPGTLSREELAYTTWRREELSILAWALGRVSMPRIHQQHKPRWLAAQVGFLSNEEALELLETETLESPGRLAQVAVTLDELREKATELWEQRRTDELAMAVCVATERRRAVGWLLGERRLNVEDRPADA